MSVRAFLAALLLLLLPFHAAAQEEAPVTESLLAAPAGTTPQSLGPRIDTRALSLPRFRILYTPRAAAAAVLLSKTVELERDGLAQRLGRDYEGVTEIRVGDGPDEAEALAPQGPGLAPPRWAAGVAYPSVNVLLLDARVLYRDEARQVLVHELSHLALGRTGKGLWPRWFQEGFAMLVAGEWSVSRYTAMYRATVGEAAIPLSSLVNRWPDRQSEVEIAYAESLSFVGHVFEKWGEERFRRLIDQVAEGKDFDASFRGVFGVELASEEALWKQSLGTKYTWLPVLSGTGTLWMFITLIFLAAYVRTRFRTQARLLAMELEEKAREAALRIAAAERAALLASMPPANDDTTDDDDPSEEPPATNEGPGPGTMLH